MMKMNGTIRPSGSEVKIGIVMPILNQQVLALEAIASMRSRFDLEFFPINNWVHGYSVAASWNIGVMRAIHKGCGLIIIANDDILVSKYAIDRMAVEMYSNLNLALLTGKDYRDRVTVTADNIEKFDPEFSAYDNIRSVVTDYAFFMLRPEAYMDIGVFDETFAPAYFEDNDYHRRIEVHPRWESYQLLNAPFYHYGSKTQFADPKYPVCAGPQFEANRVYYEKKWGGLPGHEKFTEPFGGTIVDTGITA